MENGMNMEELLKKKKEDIKNTDKNLILKAKKAELSNNERELDFTRKVLDNYTKEAERMDKELSLKTKINEVMLKNFDKMPDKANYAYELTEEYVALLKEYQVILNERQKDEFLLRKEQLLNSIQKEKENITASELNIKLLKEEIENGRE